MDVDSEFLDMYKCQFTEFLAMYGCQFTEILDMYGCHVDRDPRHV